MIIFGWTISLNAVQNSSTNGVCMFSQIKLVVKVCFIICSQSVYMTCCQSECSASRNNGFLCGRWYQEWTSALPQNPCVFFSSVHVDCFSLRQPTRHQRCVSHDRSRLSHTSELLVSLTHWNLWNNHYMLHKHTFAPVWVWGSSCCVSVVDLLSLATLLHGYFILKENS